MFPLLYNPRGKRKIEDHSYSTGKCLMIKAVSTYKWPAIDWLLLKLNHIFWESSKWANLVIFLTKPVSAKPFTEHWLHRTVQRNASHFAKRKTQWIASYITKSSYLVISAVGKGPRPPLGTLGSLRNDDDDDDEGNEKGKKAIGLDKQNNNFARASRFFVHFSAVVARRQHGTA